MKMIYINTDGGSRGNPGPAAIGAVFYSEQGEVLHRYKEFIGNATNNEAEYRAIIKALEILLRSKWLKENFNSDSEVHCRLDSKLVVEQLCGNYKTKQVHIYNFAQKVFGLLKEMGVKVYFTHVPREENKEADRLVNEALDEKLKSLNQSDVGE